MEHTVYLSLGSNLGNREELLKTAIEKIKTMIGTVVRQSSFHETQPWGFTSLNLFLNAAVCLQTSLTPRQVLETAQAIEREMGRKRESQPKGNKNGQKTGGRNTPIYHDRPIDIDILLYDDLKIDEDDLKIPHPLMQERDFVMTPLKEILNETEKVNCIQPVDS